jgi:hypothetical protein
MPELRNPKHEQFAQNIARGLSPTDLTFTLGIRARERTRRRPGCYTMRRFAQGFKSFVVRLLLASCNSLSLNAISG